MIPFIQLNLFHLTSPVDEAKIATNFKAGYE